jgi:hypothetical protein
VPLAVSRAVEHDSGLAPVTDNGTRGLLEPTKRKRNAALRARRVRSNDGSRLSQPCREDSIVATTSVKALSILLLSLTIGAGAIPPAAADDAKPSITVGIDHKGDVYIVVATLTAPVVPADAWAVLTDFDEMASFMPQLKSSRVLRRADDYVLVQQRGQMELGSFRMPFESDRKIEMEPPGLIRSHQVRGNMQRVDSTTTFTEIPGGTRVDYRVEIVPKLWIPEGVAGPMMRDAVDRQFTAVLKEIMRRKTQ